MNRKFTNGYPQRLLACTFLSQCYFCFLWYSKVAPILSILYATHGVKGAKIGVLYYACDLLTHVGVGLLQLP